MAFCPNLPLPTVQAGAEGPQAAEIKNDFLGTVGLSHPMDGYRPCRHWPPVSMATARLQENKWAVGLWIGASLGDREGLPRPSEGTWQAPPIPHPPPRRSLGLGLSSSFVNRMCVSHSSLKLNSLPLSFPSVQNQFIRQAW